jgi:hypothetical protein
MRLQWQPQPLAEQRIPGGRWHRFIPEFRLLAPADATQGALDPAVAVKYEALLAFRARIPADLASTAEPFRSHQWPLLQLLSDSKGACDLARSNPVLAFAVASNHEIRMTPLAVAPDQAMRHCNQKQREIARWLGFPDSEAMVRVFRKVPLDLASPTLLRLLRNAAATSEGLKMLGRIPRVNMGIIHLLGQPTLAKLVTWPLIQEVAASPDEHETASTGDALIDALAMLGEMLALGTPAPFNSIRQVVTFRETVLREYQQYDRHDRYLRLKARGHAVTWVELPRTALPQAPRRPDVRRPKSVPRKTTDPFPQPPLPGTETIHPLQTPAELIEEGHLQRNCIGNRVTYEPHIYQHRCYVYKVLAPERATLSLIRCGAEAWSIGELKSAGNCAVGPATWRVVRDWLDGNQVSL